MQVAPTKPPGYATIAANGSEQQKPGKDEMPQIGDWSEEVANSEENGENGMKNGRGAARGIRGNRGGNYRGRGGGIL
jgi:hypothetical protein